MDETKASKYVQVGVSVGLLFVLGNRIPFFSGSLYKPLYGSFLGAFPLGLEHLYSQRDISYWDFKL